MIRKTLLVVVIVIASTALIGLISAYLMLPKAHLFFLEDRLSMDERATLRQELSDRLAEFRSLSMGPSYVSSALNDADRRCPMDVTIMVYGIESFTLEKGRFPDSLREVFDAGYINEASLEWEYRLRRQGEEWMILNSTGITFAAGN